MLAPLLLAALALAQAPPVDPDAPPDGLFPGDRLNAVPVWSRVADFDPRLRSVEAAEISPDGRTVATASKFGYQVMAFRVADGFLLWEAAHESEVECVCWSPDSSRIATGGEDYTVRVWDAKTGEQVRVIELNAGPDGIAWSAGGATVAAGLETGEVVLLDTSDWSERGRLPGGSTVNSLQFVPGPGGEPDRYLAVAGNVQDPEKEGAAAYSGFARKYDLKRDGVLTDGEPEWEFADPAGSLKSIRVRPARTGEPDVCAVGGFNMAVVILDWETGGELRRLGAGARYEAVAFTPSGGFLVAGGHRPRLDVWRTDTWAAAPDRLPVPRTEYVHFSPDGRLMLTAHEDTGLVNLYLRDADLQRRRADYDAESLKQLDNRDMRPGERGGN